jgi:hypothetical protein
VVHRWQAGLHSLGRRERAEAPAGVQLGSLSPNMIDLPIWPSLTAEFDGPPPNAVHNQHLDVPSLTSARTDDRTPLIARLPASGLGVRFPRGVQTGSDQQEYACRVITGSQVDMQRTPRQLGGTARPNFPPLCSTALLHQLIRRPTLLPAAGCRLVPAQPAGIRPQSRWTSCRTTNIATQRLEGASVSALSALRSTTRSVTPSSMSYSHQAGIRTAS